MFMQYFSSLACTQTDLDKFLIIFEENFRMSFILETLINVFRCFIGRGSIFLILFCLKIGLSTIEKRTQHFSSFFNGRFLNKKVSTKFQDFSEKLLSEFKKHPNLSMQFYT
jgi:hypothetical protein